MKIVIFGMLLTALYSIAQPTPPGDDMRKRIEEAQNQQKSTQRKEEPKPHPTMRMQPAATVEEDTREMFVVTIAGGGTIRAALIKQTKESYVFSPKGMKNVKVTIPASQVLKIEPEVKLSDGKFVVVYLKGGGMVAGVLQESTPTMIVRVTSKTQAVDGFVRISPSRIEKFVLLGYVSKTDEEEIRKVISSVKTRVEAEQANVAARLAAEEKELAEAKKKEEEEKKKAVELQGEKKIEKEMEDLAKGIELKKKFPPPDGLSIEEKKKWGEEKKKEIKAKIDSIGALYGSDPPSKDEQEFYDNYDLWLKAVEAVEKAKEDEKKKKEEEEKKSESGQPK